VNHQTFFFNHSKTELFGQYWKPTKFKAVVMLVHGMGEHSSRYTSYVIPELVKNQIGVIAFDNFGHGKSKGIRGHNPGYETIMEVMDIIIKRATAIFESKPIFLYGHSMGGNLVINYTLRNRIKTNGIIATSPFLKLVFQPPQWKVILGKLLQKIMPTITLKTGLDITALSKDHHEINAYKNDPLVHDKISPNFSFPFMEAGIWALDNASLLKTPMLLTHGKKDSIIDYNGSLLFSNQTENASLELFEEGYHELHNDIEKKVMLKKIVNWIDNNV